MTRPAHRRHAVVIGGSMAGLLAARALADHFDRVTVLERDTLPDGPDARKGTPQARHIHVLLTAGRRALEQLFPGLMAELIAAVRRTTTPSTTSSGSPPPGRRYGTRPASACSGPPAT